MSLIAPNFSHIYVERAARELPDAQRVLKRFSKATVVEVDDYKHVFNRRKQDFQAQKGSMKLILAQKKDQFIYDGSPFAPDFGAKTFCYNALMLNCVYNCDYCYLQGMYNSANIVAFVNSKPFFEAAEATIREQGPLYLCISYDTDLLAFESVIPHCQRWIEWCASQPQAEIEIRTKSANFAAIANLRPNDRCILAWTLSPADIVKRYEPRTAPLQSRLAAARDAIDAGWRIRLCIDPILRVDNWRAQYLELVETLAAALPTDGIRDVSVGTFRMNRDFLKTIQAQRQDSDVLFYPFARYNTAVGYPVDEQDEMSETVVAALRRHLPAERVCPVLCAYMDTSNS